MTREMELDDPSTDGISRRKVLKRIGSGVAIAWTAPVIQSIRSPAFAATPPGGGCITLPRDATVTARIDYKAALHTLEFGLQSPQHVVVCSACNRGESANVGTYPAGTGLLFYMRDHGGLCDGGCDVTYFCTDTCNAEVIEAPPGTWTIQFQDSGCGCGGKPCGARDFNLGATISLS